jgi:hypothetical protein
VQSEFYFKLKQEIVVLPAPNGVKYAHVHVELIIFFTVFALRIEEIIYCND